MSSAPRLVLGMRPAAFWAGLLGMCLALPLGWMLLHGPAQRRSASVAELPLLGTLPPFTLQDQDNKLYDLTRMQGHVSIVNFIFTTCPTVCPMLSQKMASVQQRTQSLGTSVQLVSFSVDPETDTPAVLKSFGAHYKQDPVRWTFVTGPIDAVTTTIGDGFKIALTREKKPVPDGKQDGFDIVHGEQFVLVDAQARIRGYYHKDDADLDRLIKDAAQLALREARSQESARVER